MWLKRGVEVSLEGKAYERHFMTFLCLSFNVLHSFDRQAQDGGRGRLPWLSICTSRLTPTWNSMRCCFGCKKS